MATNVQYRADLLAEPLPSEPSNLEESSIDFIAIAHVLRLHRKFIAIAGVIFFLLATVLAFSMRNRYTARVSFIPASSNSSSASMASQLAQLSSFGGLLGASRTSGDLYIGLIKSTTMQSRMIARFNMMSVYKLNSYSKAEKRLMDHTEMIFGKDGIFILEFTDHDPVRARDVAEGYLQELQQVNQNLALTESSQRRLFFEQQLKREKDALADAEVALKQNEEKTGVIAPLGQASSELQSMAALRMQIADRRVRLASLLHDETDQNPDVLRLRSEIGSLEAQLTQMHTGKNGVAPGAISSAQAPGLELDFIRLARDVKYHEGLFEILSRQYETARLDESHDTPLQLLDHARIPKLHPARRASNTSPWRLSSAFSSAPSTSSFASISSPASTPPPPNPEPPILTRKLPRLTKSPPRHPHRTPLSPPPSAHTVLNAQTPAKTHPPPRLRHAR